MSDADKVAMYERALRDIKQVKGLVTGEWADIISATWLIASDALNGRYAGWVARPDEDDEESEDA